ncbi:MAG: primosomal protein N' [Chloroflexi bacterium]|nr:primosomal protein N' [Chloroflexota bacterium]
MSQYAEVAVNAAVARPRTFTYAIPPGLTLEVGQALWVPFGSRWLQGLVFGLSDTTDLSEVREVAEVIDPRPLLSPAQVQLARWLAEHYHCALFQAAALMLPPGFERRTLAFYSALPGRDAESLSQLASEEREFFDFICRHGRVEQRQLERRFSQKRVQALGERLRRYGLLARATELAGPRIRPKTARALALACPRGEAEAAGQRLAARAPRQARLLAALAAAAKPLPWGEAAQGDWGAAARALVAKGLAAIVETPVVRDPLAGRWPGAPEPVTLTAAQEAAWQQIRQALEGGEPSRFLLHGVTGSGKTELYLRALAHCLALGRRGIVLVPEIALTSQTIDRFLARFPGQVAVLHSGLSPGEQFDEWHRIRAGEFAVVIGPRSALFAPQPDLGLVVVDEEHAEAYKQEEPDPRYHAREAAERLAERAGAVLILGSATPDIVTFHRARRGELRLLELPERPAPESAGLPPVEIVDMRQELKEGNAGSFSRALARGMREALAAGEQAILFLNRRGTATFIQCRDCGQALRCRRCDVPLVYHGAEGGLMCHLCRYRAPVPLACPACGGRRIKYLGLGTQRVEEEVGRLFPGVGVLRWDWDVTRGKGAHEDILRRFLAREAQVLVGTQMVAKGLDLPEVTLVGVVNADVGLYLPDFRAAERTFQLVTQVAGRAGRGRRPGRAVLQTYNPGHYALVAAAAHDYGAFFAAELAQRRRLRYPPYTRLARLLFQHPNAARCRQEAESLARRLRQEMAAQGLPGLEALGPAPAFHSRVRGRHRWQIILRGPDPAAFLKEVDLPRDWAVDIDPVSFF